MTETNETTSGVPREFWVDAAGALASAADLGPAFLVDADPTDRRALLLAAFRMRADLRSTVTGSVGARLSRLEVLADQAERHAAVSGDDLLSSLGRDLEAARRELAARAAARVRFYRREARSARRRRSLALRPLSETVTNRRSAS